MMVRVGIAVGHRIRNKHNVVTVIIGATCCCLDAGAGRNARQENLSYAPLTQIFIQRCPDERTVTKA